MRVLDTHTYTVCRCARSFHTSFLWFALRQNPGFRMNKAREEEVGALEQSTQPL